MRFRHYCLALSLTAIPVGLFVGCSSAGNADKLASGAPSGTSGSSTGGTGGSTTDIPLGMGGQPGNAGSSIIGASGNSTGNPGNCSASDPAKDDDGDGWSENEGDCNDCDPNSNPGAIDVLNYEKDANGDPTTTLAAKQIDEDCSGAPATETDPTTCDDGLPIVVADPFDAAKAIGLCKVKVEENPSDKSKKTWGVISAGYNSIDKPFLSDPLSNYMSNSDMEITFGNVPSFGKGTMPQEGKRMFVISTGQARAAGQQSYTPPEANPLGGGAPFTSITKGFNGAYPSGFPKNGTCGPTSGNPFDGAALDMKIRVPSNAKSFSFKFRFFTYEYPDYACTAFYDVFAALMSPYPLPGDSMEPNIAFETTSSGTKNVIGVNNSSFLTTCTTGTDNPATMGKASQYTNCMGEGDLSGTGFEKHGASAWLSTTVPIPDSVQVKNGGDGIINLRFAIWDTSDGNLDSTTVIDDFKWSADEGQLGTVIAPPEVPK
jgi:hypothetical protein